MTNQPTSGEDFGLYWSLYDDLYSPISYVPMWRCLLVSLTAAGLIGVGIWVISRVAQAVL